MDLSQFGLLLLLFIIIFTLIGMELFAFKIAFNDIASSQRISNILNETQGTTNPSVFFPESTFNTINEAIASVFIILANDGWSTIYILHTRGEVSQPLPAIYFLLVLVLGQYVLTNLFITILIIRFDEEAKKWAEED